MSDLRISQLTQKTTLNDTDLIPIVDSTSNPIATKSITLANAKITLAGIPGPAGTQYPWKGLWLTATSYSVNDLVQNNGSSYVCLTAHTSGTFATDLAAAKWSLMVQGISTGAPSVTGSRGSNAALASLLTTLAALGIITDNSS